jgi:uncharacterized membrane protein YebE (DUF533 family)
VIDAKKLLEQFLGPQSPAGSSAAAPGAAAGGDWRGDLARLGADAKTRFEQSGGLKGPAGMALAGGVLGLMLGNKKLRKMAGGAAGYGGAALIGALAYRAFENWKGGNAPAAPAELPATAAALPPPAALPSAYLPSAQPAADGQPFELMLVKAMIAAAKADGHIDAAEQARVFRAVEEQGLDAAAKAFVFDALAAPSDLGAIAAAAKTPEQKAELYLAARLAIEPDQPAERAFLDALSHRLGLAPALRAHLDREIETVSG